MSISRLIIASVLFAAPQIAAAQEITLKIAHFLPAGAPAQQRVLMPWCETLKMESNGRIACQFYPAMQLGGTPGQLVDQVKNGVVDIVWTAPGYSTGRFPRIEAFELPFIVRDAKSGSRAVWQFYEQYARDEFASYKVLSIYSAGGETIHTGSHQVRELADWRGLKLRAATRLGTKTVAALGAAPVAMPPSALTESISKGVVDGVMSSWELVKALKLDEVTQFHTEPPAGQPYPSSTVLMVLMNRQKFDALPVDLKALIDKHSGAELVAKFGEVFDDEGEQARRRVISGGNRIVEFTPEQLAAMHTATASVEAEWIASVTSKGIDGKTLVEAAHALARQK